MTIFIFLITFRQVDYNKRIETSEKLYWKEMIPIIKKSIDYILDCMTSSSKSLHQDVVDYVKKYFNGKKDIIMEQDIEVIGSICLAAVYYDESIEFEIEKQIKLSTIEFLLCKAWYSFIIKNNTNASIKKKTILGKINN